MATQGTTVDLMELLNLMNRDAKGKRLMPEGKFMFLFDPPNTYNRAIGIILDEPENGGMDAPFGGR